MLFDLQGKRKRFVQVIYAGLAFLIGGGLVFFGIGGAGGGGLLDALGVGGSGTATSANYDDQINRANDALDSNPKDQQALILLARYEFLDAQDQREVDDNGLRRPTEGTIDGYRQSADAWERYLATKPERPNEDVATLMKTTVYPALYAVDTNRQDEIANQLLRATQVVADARPALTNYQDLASLAYFLQKDELGDEAAKKALAEAPDANTKKQLEQSFKDAQAQAKLAAKQSKQQQAASGAQGSGTLPDAPGILGGSSATAPTTGTAPAP